MFQPVVTAIGYLVKLDLFTGDVIYMKYLFPPPYFPNTNIPYFFYGESGGTAIVSHTYCVNSTESCDVGLIKFDETTFDLVYANYYTHPSGGNSNYHTYALYDAVNNGMNYIRIELSDFFIG